jgi:hypothetical protein
MKLLRALVVFIFPAICFSTIYKSDVYDDTASTTISTSNVEAAWLSTRTVPDAISSNSVAHRQRNLQVLQQICNTVIDTVLVFDAISCDCEISATSGIVGLLCNTTNPVCAPGGNLCGTPSWFGSFALLGGALYSQLCYVDLVIFGSEYDPFCLDYELNVFELFSGLLGATADSNNKNAKNSNTKSDSNPGVISQEDGYNEMESTMSPTTSDDGTGKKPKGNRRQLASNVPTADDDGGYDDYYDDYYDDDGTGDDSTEAPTSPPSIQLNEQATDGKFIRGPNGVKNQNEDTSNKKPKVAKGVHISQDSLFTGKTSDQKDAKKFVKNTRNFDTENNNPFSPSELKDQINNTSANWQSISPSKNYTVNSKITSENNVTTSSNDTNTFDGRRCKAEFGDVPCNTCIICKENMGIVFDCTNIVPRFTSMNKCVRFDMLTNWKNMTQGRLTGAFPEIESLY